MSRASSARKQRVRLVHWNASEAEDRVAQMRAAGYEVEFEGLEVPGLFRRLRERPPDMIVIDLTRMPSYGREVGLQIRRMKTLRSIPLVFAGGAPEKVEAVRGRLPDAIFASWEEIGGALAECRTKPLSHPIVPAPIFAEYAHTPLFKKLGVKSGVRVALVGAPAGFEATLGELPDGAALRRGLRGKADLLLWFVKSRSEVQARIVKLGSTAGADGLWIIWPKRASGVKTDLTQQVVRDLGLDSGLVDYKVCSVDATWTGLRFTRRAKKG